MPKRKQKETRGVAGTGDREEAKKKTQRGKDEQET